MTKLEVLKNYLQYVLDNKYEHKWSDTTRCHCGMLLKSLLLETLPHVREDDPYYDLVNKDTTPEFDELDGWYRFVFTLYKSNNCTVTNIPFTSVIEQLLSYGFTLDELINLEHLQDKRFIDLDINNRKVRAVDMLITYLTNWIKYEEQIVQATTKEQVPVKVSIS